jgi:tetratricopeptide (TPR) repeat protein
VDNVQLPVRLAAARAYIQAKQYDKALQQAAMIIEAAPTLAVARGLRAEALLGKGRLDEALVEVHSAIERERKTEFLTILGRIHEASGQEAAAIEAYAEALKQNPDQHMIRFRRAVMLVRAGGVRLGLAELRQVLRTMPDFAEAYLYSGIALAERGQEAQALRAYKTAVAKDPTLAEAHYRIGQILFDKRQIGAAIHAVKQATRLAAPSDGWLADAYFLLARAALSQNQRSMAIDALKRCLASAPPKSTVHKDARSELDKLGVRP